MNPGMYNSLNWEQLIILTFKTMFKSCISLQYKHVQTEHTYCVNFTPLSFQELVVPAE